MIGTHDGDQADSTFDYVVNNLEPQQTRGVIKGNLKDMDVQIENDPVMNRMPSGDDRMPTGAIKGSTPILPTGEFKINTKHDVKSGAVAGKDNNTVYIDPSIPHEFHPFLAVHEETEKRLMAGGMNYDRSHIIATLAEKHAVEGSGMTWDKYTNAVDPYVAKAEKGSGKNPPPDPHVNIEDAIGHHADKASALEHADKQIGQGQLTPESRQTAHDWIGRGMKMLGIGGGAMDLLEEGVRNTTGKLFYPLERLGEYRKSPDYKGNKPQGNTEEETNALRGLKDREDQIDKLRKDMGLEPGPRTTKGDLDVRPSKPLPVLPPVPSIAPHNPNPPGGGPYRTKPGEKLSSNWKGEGSDLEGPHKPLGPNQEWIPEPGMPEYNPGEGYIKPDWLKMETDPTGKEKGYRITYPDAPLVG